MKDPSQFSSKPKRKWTEMDGGVWGIVIVVSAFMIQVFVFGVSVSIGVFNIELLDYFDNDTVGVSLIAAVKSASFLGSGPVVSLALMKFSYRKVALFGSVLVTFGLAGNALLPYIPAMCFCFGFVSGFGCNCLYMSSHVLSGLYYDKNRSLATGIASAGSGMGFAIMPIVVGWLIEIFTWKGAFVVLAGLCLHCFVFSGLLRPPPAHPTKTEASSSSKNAINDHLSNGDCSQRPFLEVQVEGKDGVSLLSNGNAQTKDRLDYDCDYQVDQYSGKLTSEKIISDKFERTPKTARHIYVFTSFAFCLYFFNNVLWCMGTSVIHCFGPEFFTSRGLSPMKAASVFSAYGFGNVVGAVFGGVLGNFKSVNRIVFFSANCVLLGLFISLMPVFNHTAWFALAIGISGTAFGIILGLLIVVLTDLLGPESLGNGLGYLMFSNGIGNFIGPPFAGAMYRVFGRWDEAIYIAGIFCILSGVVMLLIPISRCFSKSAS